MSPYKASTAKAAAVWCARILAGAMFILSGWSKTVDPHGFVFKIDEYLNVWGIAQYVFPQLVTVGAIGLSIAELTIGVLLASGCLRRTAAVAALCVMAFMLPLTVYIYVANPVADCGCFGDLLVVSNGATLLKNIVATALLILCLVWHRHAAPLYRPALQWLVVVMTVFYGIAVAFVGWQLQPVVDFRPFAPSKSMVPDEDETTDSRTYIYERDGQRREFSLDQLPDSTWTFVDLADHPAEADHRIFEIFDGDDEVTYDVLDGIAEGDALILGISQPSLDNLTRSRMANELYRYARDNGIEMFGVAALSGEALEQWEELTLPEYPLYSSSDTSIKELVRGSMGLVFLHDGTVVWKRDFTTLPPDLLEYPRPLEAVWRVDDGRLALVMTSVYGCAMLALLLISQLTRITFSRASKRHSDKEKTDTRQA